MVNYYVRRTARVFATVFAVMTVTFRLIRLLPEAPYTQLRAQLLRSGSLRNRSTSRSRTCRTSDLTHRWEQYINYMISVVQQNLGQSISKGIR